MSQYIPWTEMVSRDYESLHWREANELVKDLIKRIPDRIGMLEVFVRESPDFEGWKADYSDESFKRLGPWALQNLERREFKQRPEEVRLIISNPNLTEDAIQSMRESFAATPIFRFLPDSQAALFDIGLYMGERIKRDVPSSQWTRFKKKHYREYNMPVLNVTNNQSFKPLLQPDKTAFLLFGGIIGDSCFLDGVRDWIRRGLEEQNN